MKCILAFGLILTAGAAQAGETFDSTGTITGQSAAKIYPVAEGQLVMELSNTHDAFDMAVDGHPFTGLSGTCTGGAEMRGAAVTGSGVCQYSDDAGNTAFVRFGMDSASADGALVGSWVMIGGTGTHAGISGGGRFASQTNRETGAVQATLTGAVTLP